MTIVPAGEAAEDGAQTGLVAEVMLLNKDVGFVREGQEVAVKLEAFPFTDYGLVPGTLTQISRDAVEQEGVGLVYTGRVALDCAAGGGGNAVPASTPAPPATRRERQTAALCRSIEAGMAVTAEIKTDQRRIIDYFLSPIAKATAEAGRER